MVSYWKTQWFKFLLGCIYMVFAIYCMFQPAADESTLAGLNINVDNMFDVLAFWSISIFWFVSSVLNYNADCIKALNERIEILETRAITDIDKVSNNNYEVRRRLGPDKNVPYPEEVD